MAKKPMKEVDCNKFPTKPGVYLMKDEEGRVLYVGKAINLRQRIRQYFSPGGDGRASIPHLMRRLKSVDTIVVTSEKEALLLENNLIKLHQPRYNILLKDDKSYIAIKVAQKQPYPRLLLVRYRGEKEKKEEFYGPYASAQTARQTVELLNNVLQLRSCSDEEMKRRQRPCILHGMKRCLAPCVNKCSQEEYKGQLKVAIDFLKGNPNQLTSKLTAQMLQAAEEWDFEKAAVLQKKIAQLHAMLEKQQVDLPQGGDADAIALYRQADRALIALLQRRNGKLIGLTTHCFEKSLQEDEEIIASFILQHYESPHPPPSQIITSLSQPLRLQLADLLKKQTGKKTQLLMGQRGAERALLNIAELNAKEAWEQKKAPLEREELLFELKEKLHLSRFPERIDCFDNSHIAGSEAVAAMVVFRNGVADKSCWRCYKLRSSEAADDYGSLQEALRRRLERAIEGEGELPDLLLIDGGPGHLSSAKKVIDEMKIVTIDLLAIAKEEGRHDKGVRAEKLYCLGSNEPVLLPRHSPLLFFLQQIRDEAHRFVLEYHKKRRSKALIKSRLDEVIGIGPVKKKALLQHFGSAKKVFAASDEELLAVAGIGKKELQALRAIQ